MLTSFRFGNLGLFPQVHRLDFKPTGSSKGNMGIFIGANATGKSSCLEFIRRCLSEQINHRKSTVFSREKPGWALASFKIDRDTLYKYGSQNTLEYTFGHLGTENKIFTLWTGVIFDDIVKCTVRFIQLDTHDGPVCIKEVTSQTGENPRATYQRYGKPVVTNDEIPLPYPEDLLETDGTNDQIIKEIYCSVLGRKGLVTSIFDQRGVGAIASTRNIESNPEAHEKNYTTSEERAVLMLDLLREVEESGKREDYEKIATRLTNDDKWKLYTESGRLRARHSASPDGPNDILKLPAGVYEAHLFSLLITTTEDFSTVIIDDPSRGMHPDMAENLRETMLDLVRKRNISIIISTHAEQFVSRETWLNIYRFSKCVHSDTLFCHQLPSSGIDILTGFHMDEVRKWLFSSSIILVEGITDEKVIKALLCRLRTNDRYHRLASAKVIQCKGKFNIGKLQTFLDDFGVPVSRVYDADALGIKANETLWAIDNTPLAELFTKQEMPDSVNVDIGKKVAQSIRKMLNKSHVLQEENDIDTDIDTDALYFDKNTIKFFEKEIRNAKDMLSFLWKNMKEFPECKDFCNSLQFVLDLVEVIPEDAAQADDTSKYIYVFSEIGHLLLVEHLLSPVWNIDNIGDNVEVPFYWGCGTIEDVINVTLRRKFHDVETPMPWLIKQGQLKGTRIKRNYIWYCQKETLGKIDGLCDEELRELCDDLIQDLDNNKHIRKCLNYLVKNLDSNCAKC